MNTFTTLITAAALLTSTAAIAGHHSSKELKTVKSSAGNVLANAKGMTLYTFDKDAKNTSNCSGGCASSWPPAKAKDGAETHGSFATIKRGDGSFQYTINGKPLYTWAGDKKPGDITGNGVGGVWHIVPR